MIVGSTCVKRNIDGMAHMKKWRMDRTTTWGGNPAPMRRERNVAWKAKNDGQEEPHATKMPRATNAANKNRQTQILSTQ